MAKPPLFVIYFYNLFTGILSQFISSGQLLFENIILFFL